MSSGLFPLLLFSAAILSFGCGRQEQHFVSYAPPSLEPSVTSDVQTQAGQIVQQFSTDLGNRDLEAAEKIMSPSLKAKLPPSSLAKSAQNEYKPLTEAASWQFRSFDYHNHGKTLLVHSHFMAGGKQYNTNFGLEHDGSSWLIDLVLPPNSPVKAEGRAIHHG